VLRVLELEVNEKIRVSGRFQRRVNLVIGSI